MDRLVQPGRSPLLPSAPALAAAATTRYLVAALRELPAEQREHDVPDEDAARLSPLKHANLDVLGR